MSGRNIHQLPVSAFPEVTQFGCRVERGAKDRDGMMQQLEPAVAGRPFREARRVSTLAHVPGNVPVEIHILADHCGQSEWKLRRPHLLNPHSSLFRIDGLPEVRDFPDCKRGFRSEILTQIRILAFALDSQRPYREDPGFSSHRIGRCLYRIQLGRPIAAKKDHGGHHRR